jgi:hypothetical protein
MAPHVVRHESYFRPYPPLIFLADGCTVSLQLAHPERFSDELHFLLPILTLWFMFVVIFPFTRLDLLIFVISQYKIYQDVIWGMLESLSL